MLELLRDPAWQFGGVVVTILVFIISGFMEQRQQLRRSLGYQVLSSTPLVSINADIKSNLQIMLDGKSVQDVYLILVRIVNMGNAEIRATDYERPITLDFGPQAEILSAEVTDTSSKSLQPLLDIKGPTLVLAPALINSGESITIKALIIKFHGSISVDGRIAGIRDIRRLPALSDRGYQVMIRYTVGYAFCLSLLVSAVLFYSLLQYSIDLLYWMLFIMGCLVGVTGWITIATITNWLRRRGVRTP